MTNSAGTIQCPNYSCQADNQQSDKFCHSCGTPLIKRYLWAMGSGIDPYKLGDAIADRYLLVRERILLDTTPAVPPDTPEEVLKLYQAYYDSNHFELAMMLSTPTEQERLQNVNKLIDNSEEQDSTVFLTKFVELQCKPKGKKDTVLCECLLEDRFGPYQQPFRIVKLNNQWLVDKLEDDFMIDENPDNDIQKFLDSLENGYY